MDVNGSSSAFTSVLAGTSGLTSSSMVNFVIEIATTTSAWTWAFTILAMCVVYDQSMFTQTVALLYPKKQLRIGSPSP